jgi:protein-S-isoprenylcysteine O-methyltransferase Ste14
MRGVFRFLRQSALVPDSQRSRIYAFAQNLVLVLFAATVLFAGPPLFVSTAAHAIGLALCGLGLLLIASAFISLRKVIQIAPEPRSGGHLVTGGIYGWMRHPIYTAIVLMVIGLFLRRPTLAVAIAAAVVVGFLFVKTRFEERLLTIRYPEYVEYRKRTWGLIPGIC